ncbi:MAG: hypothetical protein ACI9AX_002537, partial [Polaromonas sp.]
LTEVAKSSEKLPSIVRSYAHPLRGISVLRGLYDLFS